MEWTAIVPLKLSHDRKSRLSARFSVEERIALSDKMAMNVLDCLKQARVVSNILVLSPTPFRDYDWLPDRGKGLNAELVAFRTQHPDQPLLTIHGDLPLLSAADVEEFLRNAEFGEGAIAPDRHRSGTNAVAVTRPGGFGFAFGVDSFKLHQTSAGAGFAVVERPGLAFDVDTLADFDAIYPAV